MLPCSCFVGGHLTCYIIADVFSKEQDSRCHPISSVFFFKTRLNQNLQHEFCLIDRHTTFLCFSGSSIALKKDDTTCHPLRKNFYKKRAIGCFVTKYAACPIADHTSAGQFLIRGYLISLKYLLISATDVMYIPIRIAFMTKSSGVFLKKMPALCISSKLSNGSR